MTGYDQTTSYPSQYNYVPNLQSPDPSLVAGGVDPRHLQSWGMATANQSHAHYTHMQGSPGQHHPASAGHRGYSSYYDRNGYYVHQHGAAAAAAATGNGGGAFDSWHDPGGMRPESPTNSGAGLTAPPNYPSPAAVSTSGGSSSVNYSCKMAVQPPAHSAGATPPSPTQQKTNDNPQLQSPYGGGQPPYGQCQLSQNSQQAGGAAGGGAVTPNSFSSQLPPQAGGGPPGVHNNYPMNEGSATPGGPGPAGGSSAGAPMGQPSPVQQGGGQNQSGAPQASLPSPLYPWMRSQFGKTCFFIVKRAKRAKPRLSFVENTLLFFAKQKWQ